MSGFHATGTLEPEAALVPEMSCHIVRAGAVCERRGAPGADRPGEGFSGLMKHDNLTSVPS